MSLHANKFVIDFLSLSIKLIVKIQITFEYGA